MERRALAWMVLLLTIVAVATLTPLWTPLLLAAWVAHLSAPLTARLERLFRGRRSIAAGATVLLISTVLVPVGAAVVSLARGAGQLVRSLMSSPEWGSALKSLATEGNGGSEGMFSPAHVLSLVREHGAAAWKVVGDFAGAAAGAVIAAFIFVFGTYVFLVDGSRAWAWIRLHSPLRHDHATRMADAFHETGRGLIVGMGLTAAVQGVIATIAYSLLGVPRALVLGFLTFIAAFIPSVGTAIVWVPVAAGLALTGHYGAAAILTGVGVLVISTVDNVLRPVIARRAKLQLPVFIQMVAIFGGFALFGAAGLVLGPLVFRLAREALAIAREEKLVGERVPHREDHTPGPSA